MNRGNAASAWRNLAASWLAGALALLLVGLAISSAGHCEHNGRHAHPDCAACAMAQGGVVANGATGATVIIFDAALALPVPGDFQQALLADLRLAPGRAPPV